MKSILTPGNKAETHKKTEMTKSDKSMKTTKIDKKSKRKLLPVALRRQLEKDQKEIIEVYRQLKADRIKKREF